MPLQFQDGYLGTERLLSVYPEIDYPFANAPTPDVTALTLRRRYDVQPGKFVPRIAVRTAGAPDLDATYNAGAPAAHASAYLVQETAPRLVNSARATFERLYATIPSQQIIYGQQVYSRPDVPGTSVPLTSPAEYRLFGSNYLFYRADSSVQNWQAYTRRIPGTVDAISNTPTGGTATLTFNGQTTGAIAYNATSATLKTTLETLSTVSAAGNLASVSGNYNDTLGFLVTFSNIADASTDHTSLVGYYAWKSTNSYSSGFNQVVMIAGNFTGGTFTLTVLGQTTSAIAYDASVSDVQAAVNALSNVAAVGGCVVAGFTGVQISLVLDFDYPAMTGVSALTPTPSSVTVTTVAGTRGRQQYVKFAAAQTQRVITFSSAHGFASGQPLYFKVDAAFYFGRTDWTLIGPNSISVNPAYAPWTGTAITEVGGYQRDYAPGAATFRTRETTDFYLPGVTSGVATASDIPLGGAPISDAGFIEAVLAGTEYIIYSAGTLETYLGPIFQRKKVELRIPD